MMAGVTQKSENTQIHRRMNTVMPREKIKFALRISPEVQQLVKDMCPRDNCQSQNEFIEKAIRFYAGHISANDTAELLPQFFVSALRGAIQDTESRICRLLFKQAVEQDMMMNIMAAGIDLSTEDMERLRARCVKEVKKTSGTISFTDALDYQRGVT
jgi:hypothetical protein